MKCPLCDLEGGESMVMHHCYFRHVPSAFSQESPTCWCGYSLVKGKRAAWPKLRPNPKVVWLAHVKDRGGVDAHFLECAMGASSGRVSLPLEEYISQ